MPIYNPPYISPSSDSSRFIKKTAATKISRFQPVIVDESVEAASNEIAAHASKRIGIAVSSAEAGELVTIQTFGLIVSDSWSWLVQPILLGAGGTLIQGLPSTGFILVLGFPEETNSFFLDAQTPLLRN